MSNAHVPLEQSSPIRENYFDNLLPPMKVVMVNKVMACFDHAYLLQCKSTAIHPDRILYPSRHGPDFHLPQSQISIVGPDFHLRHSQKCLLGYSAVVQI